MTDLIHYEQPVPLGPPRDRLEDPSLPVIEATTLGGDIELKTQVVVIGSGAGGAVMAAELAEKGLEVIVLEQGRQYARPDFHEPPLKSYLAMYQSAGLTATLGVPGIPLPYGRAVGGTTVMNSGTCFRVPDRVFAKWAGEGLGALSKAELDRFYTKVEERIHVAAVEPTVAGKNAEIVARGVKALGLSGGFLLRNARGCAGSGRCAFGCPSGAKQSMERSYLPIAAAHGAKIYSRVKVLRILFAGGRASGVEAVSLPDPDSAPRRLIVRADQVVIAGGAINTPMLLHANHLGGWATGRFLHIHPAAKLVALMEEEVGGQGVPQAYYVDELHEQGVMLEGAYVPPEFGAVALPYVGKKHRELVERSNNLATFGMMVTDTSHGRVMRGLGGTTLIRYDLNQADADAFKKGIMLCARIFFAAGAKTVFPALAGIDRLDGEADVEKIGAMKLRPKDLELIAFHPMGTCKAGVDPRKSVVDPDLRVHGIAGLSIVDGSVIPSSIGVNPQLTIMALATRAAERIAAAPRG